MDVASVLGGSSVLNLVSILVSILSGILGGSDGSGLAGLGTVSLSVSTGLNLSVL